MPESRTLRVAVIGAGPAGQAHAFGFRNAQMSDCLKDVTIELHTICDPNTELASTVARRYGFANVVDDVQKVADNPEIDVVSMALPNFLSVPVMGTLLRAGKHVLGEKPLGRSGAEADELVKIQQETGKVAAVGFSYRRIPAVAQMRQHIMEGAIGEPIFVRAHFYADYALDPSIPYAWRFDQDASGGGTILDMAPHAIDALTYVLGDAGKATEVTACSLATHVKERTDADGSTKPVTNDDTAILSLRYGDDVLGSIVSSRSAAGHPTDLTLEVFGTKGFASWSFTRINEWQLYQTGVGEEMTDGPRTVTPGPLALYFDDTMPMAARGNPCGYGEAFIAEMQEFLIAVVEDRQMDTNLQVAADTMHIVSTALEVAKTGVPTKLS